MSYSVGDGLTAIAVAGAIVGYVHVTNLARHKKLQLIHLERMEALKNGQPLPEFPNEPAKERRQSDQYIMPIMGAVFTVLSTGTMVALFLNRSVLATGLWLAPLPLAILGTFLLVFHFVKDGLGREMTMNSRQRAVGTHTEDSPLTEAAMNSLEAAAPQDQPEEPPRLQANQ